MKNIKFTFWLIGFGCGIALSGILGTLATLNINTETNPIANNINLEQNVSPMPQETVQEVNKEETPTPPISIEASQEKELVTEAQQQEDDEKEYIEVTIPNAKGASAICKVLEEANIIADHKDFLNYVKEQKMQTRLRSGKVKLPLNAEYDELLSLLTNS